MIELGKDGEAMTNRNWCSKVLVDGGTYFSVCSRHAIVGYHITIL